MKKLAPVLLRIFNHLSVEYVELKVYYLSRILSDPFHLLPEVASIPSEDSDLLVLYILGYLTPANAHRGLLTVAKYVIPDVFYEGEGLREDKYVVRVLLDVLEHLVLQDCNYGYLIDIVYPLKHGESLVQASFG